MTIPHKPDDVKQHLPATCLKCSHFSECMPKGNVFACGEKRYEVNVVINTKVTELQTLEVKKCPYGENFSTPIYLPSVLQNGKFVLIFCFIFSYAKGTELCLKSLGL